MERWSTSLESALQHRWGQMLLAAAFLVPAFATIGQYSATGFWSQWTTPSLLFWPSTEWKWGVTMPVWVSMGAMLASYVVGIAWLVRRRTFGAVVACALGAIILANLAGAVVNWFAGWREIQEIAAMNFAGKANRVVFALWHNPVWEELVFRGVPLLFLLAVARTKAHAARWPVYAYYLVPSVVFAWYHVPGHGPSRIVDTFLLSLVFGWMARRYTFFAPLVMHYIFDAMMVPSLGNPRLNIPSSEIAWILANSGLLNSTWFITTLLWMVSLPVLLVLRRVRARRELATSAEPAPA